MQLKHQYSRISLIIVLKNISLINFILKKLTAIKKLAENIMKWIKDKVLKLEDIEK